MFNILYKRLNSAIDLLSIIIVPCLIIIFAFWLIQPALIDNLSDNCDNQVVLMEGETTKIYSPILINNGSKIQYNLKLLTMTNEVVYNYPTYYSNSINITAVSIKIPVSITKGEYKLAATINYKLNPIKKGVIKVELMRIIIK